MAAGRPRIDRKALAAILRRRPVLTAVLAGAVAPHERAVVQGASDTLIALASTVCVFASGAIVTGFGWGQLALSSLPVLAVTLLWVVMAKR